MNKKGSNQYLKKPKHNSMKYLYWYFAIFLLILFLGLMVRKHTIEQVQAEEPIISPLAESQVVPTAYTPNPQDVWIGEYADKYARPGTGKTKSLLRYQLSCLAHKENGYHSNDNCGDGGLSCGMYQYRKGTWAGFRKEMIRLGLVKETGSLWNDQQAIETTAWALANGRENNWGPILRGECK